MRLLPLLTQEIHNDGVPQEQRKAHQYPGEKRGLEDEEPEEVHADVGVPAAPHVHQHDGEGLPQEHQVHKQPKKLPWLVKETLVRSGISQLNL